MPRRRRASTPNPAISMKPRSGSGTFARLIPLAAAKESRAARSAAETADWRSKLIEVISQQDEVAAVHFAIVIEIALVPAVRNRLVEVRRHQVEIRAVHFVVEIRIAQKGIGDFDLSGSETRRIAGIGGIGIADSITAGIGLGRCWK